jgi:hypothetical protein
MAFRQFLVPEYHEFIDALGTAPETVEGETAQRLSLEAYGEAMVLTFDVTGRSVHCLWSRGERVLSEIFQEGATLLRVEDSEKGAQLSVDLETDASRGQLLLTVAPKFGIYSRILLR